jgi:hypothetical protein
MKGQSSAELLVLMGGILLTTTFMLSLGLVTNESTVATQAARDGAENAISNMSARYGCSIDIDNLTFSKGAITISVAVRNAPPDNFTWNNFSENIVRKNIREAALKLIQKAVGGHVPSVASPVKTAHYTYEVTVNTRQVTK